MCACMGMGPASAASPDMILGCSHSEQAPVIRHGVQLFPHHQEGMPMFFIIGLLLIVGAIIAVYAYRHYNSPESIQPAPEQQALPLTL